MTRTSITLEPGQSLPDEMPVNEDGSQPSFLLFEGDKVHAANSVTALVGAIIEGYDELDDSEDGNEQALWLRYQHAVDVANHLQRQAIGTQVGAGNLDLDVLRENDLNAILGDRSLPVTDIKTWQISTPLFLISTDYSPFSGRKRPEGNVIWLDPSKENNYLRSLADIGIVQFYVHEG